MKGKIKFNFTVMLLLFALIPLTCSIVILNILLINEGSKEIKSQAHNAMTSTINQTGTAFDYSVKTNEIVLKNFAAAPIFKEYLKNPNNSDLQKKAQDYTTEYFGNLAGWEGVYLADWNSKVLTHPAPPVVGKVMREGDALKSLQTSMTSADNGIYNTGIIVSPASNQLIISMYVPIYDGNKPIGYVGGGTFVNEIAANYSDVSELHLDSSYIYFVDKEGTMLYHPDPEKIGKPVENAAVKQVVADLAAGNHPGPECVSYEYKGVQKYAAYYVGDHEFYVAVVTADESEVLKNIQTLKGVSLGISAGIFIFFIIIVVIMTRVVVKPLSRITKALDDTAKGKLNADTNIHSITYETQVIIKSAATLQKVLKDIIGKTKNISEDVNLGAIDVASLADSSSDGASHIVKAMEELAHGAVAMAENVQDINQQVINMGEAVDNISEYTDALVTSSNNIKNENNEADQYMEKVSISSKQSVEAVQAITKQITETNEAITRIQDAVNMIIGIASQTNLLSLNASIEAARAGEAGRGFAVVAGEIKSLSEQSNNSANEIKEIVANIIAQSEKSVALATEVAEIISTEQGYISDTQNKFKMLSGEIQISLDQINRIAEITEELNESKVVISGAVTDLSAIAEENAASNEEVAASINDVTDSIQQIASNSDATKTLSEDLKDTISYFN